MPLRMTTRMVSGHLRMIWSMVISSSIKNAIVVIRFRSRLILKQWTAVVLCASTNSGAEPASLAQPRRMTTR
jgi:hypothetical protein